MNVNELWEFKHEPTSFDDMVFSPETRTQLKEVIKNLPNFALVGDRGIGKGTFTKFLINHLELDYLWINASDENSVDNLRSRVKDFATAMNFDDKLKLVVLNEADGIPKAHGQKLLRQLIEDVHKYTRFAVLANYRNALSDEFMDRFRSIELIPAEDKEVIKHCAKILKKENIEINKPELLKIKKIVEKSKPSIRKTIQNLQRNIIDGKFVDVLSLDSDDYFEQILNYMKDFYKQVEYEPLDEIKKILRMNSIEYVSLYEYLYNNVEKFKEPGLMIIEIGKALHNNTFSAVKEITFMTFLMEVVHKQYV